MAQTNVQPEFKTAKSSVILKLKVIPVQALVYRGFEDLEKLIKFVGSRPVINADMTIQFKKTLVPANSVVFRNEFGEVTKVMSFDDAEKMYDIAAQRDFTDSDAITPIAKEKKTRTTKK